MSPISLLITRFIQFPINRVDRDHREFIPLLLFLPRYFSEFRKLRIILRIITYSLFQSWILKQKIRIINNWYFGTNEQRSRSRPTKTKRVNLSRPRNLFLRIFQRVDDRPSSRMQHRWNIELVPSSFNPRRRGCTDRENARENCEGVVGEAVTFP